MMRSLVLTMVAGSLLSTVASAQPALREMPRDPASLDSVQPRAFVLQSLVLDEERRVDVVLPPSHHATSRAYPLVLVFDGEAILGTVSASAGALTDAGHMPEAVIVGVHNTDRLRDLSPPGIDVSGNDGSGRADLFVRFLLQELIPALANEFRARGPITLVGHSSGGLFVHFAALSRPDVFQSVVSLDAPMHIGRTTLAMGLVAAAAESDEVFRLVSLEARFGWVNDDWANLEASAPSRWALHRSQVEGESHGSMVWPASYSGLKTIFAWYSASGAHGTPTEQLAAFDRSANVSSAIPPASSLLRQVIEDHIALLELDQASATLERLIAAYGASDLTRRLRAEISAAGDEELEGPTLDQLLATPTATGNDMAALIGEWNGYTESEAGTRRPLGLSLRIEDGEVRGEFRFDQGNEHTLEYIARSGTEYHIGYMNRMRPRGMLMYEGNVEDGVFSGEFVLRGVVFKFPDGRELPRTTFHLARSK